MIVIVTGSIPLSSQQSSFLSYCYSLFSKIIISWKAAGGFERILCKVMVSRSPVNQSDLRSVPEFLP